MYLYVFNYILIKANNNKQSTTNQHTLLRGLQHYIIVLYIYIITYTININILQ